MSSSSQIVESWISSFCNLVGHEYFAEVSEDFIEDDFNLTGLSSQVPMYKEALETILDVEPEEDEEEEEEEEEDDDEELGDDRPIGLGKPHGRNLRSDNDMNQIEQSAELLFGLIHQRYITSRPGIAQMHEKYDNGDFGQCPRVYCNGCKVLPVGCSDMPGQETVKLFCPSCLDIYTPPNSRFQTVDGAFFGTTFGCLFFMIFPELRIAPWLAEVAPPNSNVEDGATTTATTTTSTTVAATPTNNNGITAAATKVSPLTEINGIAVANMAPGLGTGNIYEPRIYGFRVAERAKSGPRMKWLRMKPDDVQDLDEAAEFHCASQSTEHNDADADADADVDADGEEMDEDDEGGADAQQDNSPEAQKAMVENRKKAPMRRRRRTKDESEMAVDPNGVDGEG